MASVKSLGVHQPSGLKHAIDEQILPRDASPDLYQWEILADAEGEDEVLTTRNCVVWSRGGIFRKSFKFELETEPITQALLTYFPASEDDRLPPHSSRSSDQHQGQPALSKALVVFLKTQAHIFFLSGASHIVHMPFEVECACAAPCGIIIQRKSKNDSHAPVTLKFPRVPPNSFVSSQISPPPVRLSQHAFSTAGLGKPKTLPLRLSSTFENMWESPLETSESNWPRLVCLTDPLLELGLVVSQPDKSTRDRKRRSSLPSPFLDPAEEIIHVESITEPCGRQTTDTDPLVVAVTVNRETNMYTVWRLTYIQNEDQFINRRQKSKSRMSRRRSSMQPGLNSGATTPLHHSVRESLRESLGAPLAVKKTRKSEKGDKSLEQALSLETDRVGEANRRQSRRTSSLLARGDLSASHERSMFAEPGSLANVSTRRIDSLGSQRGRTSGGYAPVNLSGTYNQTLNSLLEIPTESLVEELRGGGDFEGFQNLGLNDHEFEGLTKEVLLTKIHCVSMENSNVRYSLSDTPARNQCKVYMVVGTAFALDEKDRSSLLICIQDSVDKRLHLLIFHLQATKASDPVSQPHGKPGHTGDIGIKVSWGQLRRAQHVVDSCKIFDGDQSMILILSEGEKNQRQLSIQAPWSELTTVNLPLLFKENPNSLAYTGTHAKKQAKTRRSIAAPVSGAQIQGIRHPRSGGVVDVQDNEGRFHRIQIQLKPSNTHTRWVLDVCRSVLPAAYAEKMVVGWWHTMQWLLSQDIQVADTEWTSLVVQLFTVFLSLGHINAATLSKLTFSPEKDSSLPSSQESDKWDALQIYSTPNTASCSPWMQNRGWQWLREGNIDDSMENFENFEPKGDDFLSLHINYAKRYMASPAGLKAIGPDGYLPTALQFSMERRRSAVWGIMMGLHLLLEEQKLDIMVPEHGSPGPMDLRVILCQIGRWLRWHDFVSLYELGVQVDVSGRNDLDLDLSPPLPEPSNLPSIFEWIQSRLTATNADETTYTFSSLADVYATAAQLPSGQESGKGRWEALTPRTAMFQRFFDILRFTQSPSPPNIVMAMHTCGFTPCVLDTLPEAVLTPLQDAISMCQPSPPPSWTDALVELVNRGDISMILQPGRPPSTNSASLTDRTHAASWDFRVLCETKDDLNNLSWDEVDGAERQAVVQALFKDDRRLYEAQNLLSSFKPRVVHLDSHPKWTESEYLEKQKELVTTIATSTLAMPAGRGMLHYGFRFPLLTQKFNIHGFNLTCVVKPHNVAVGVDKTLFTEEKVNWAFFHQGVAYGLAISPQAKGIDTSWILYNKPGHDLNNRHAGFLLALGLNGHLKSVAKWVAFKYLTPKHTMTSIGLLLGLAVSHLGTMDSLITRLLSVHVTRMLPRGAAELNLSHYTQTTGIMGIGLLYCNTQHRRMSEIMMSEIEFVEDEDEEDPLKNEGYRLAAGFALGYINLGKGNDLKGLHDMHITEKLLTLASATKKVELVNVLDRSAAGAVVAIALIFLKSEDHIVARKIDVPDSILQFDYVRPDILLLRTLAKNLILWSKIEPTVEWIRSSLPAEYRGRYKLKGLKSVQSRDLPFFAILAGLCFAIALRFAGSANLKVRDLLVHYLDHLMRIVRLPADKFDAQLARGNGRMCMDLLALSCSIVMAGTGDLVVFRRLRSLHGRDDPHTTYGSHLAAHLAIGTLFLGCGMATFGTSNIAIASLLVAFYPIFPANVQDNRSHLQAFRHFWVLAVDSRCLVARDVATGQPISVPVMIHLKQKVKSDYDATRTPKPKAKMEVSTPSNTVFASADEEEAILRKQTPCLLPPLDEVAKVRTDATAQGYWNLELDFERDPELIQAFRKNQNLYLRRRPAQDGVFAATLQALGQDNGASNGSVTSLATAAARTGDPMEWIFALNSLQGLTHAERALVLDRFAGSGGGNNGTGSSVVDARLVLENCMDGSSRDDLVGLKLLFEWADKRAAIQMRSQAADRKGKGKEAAHPRGHMADVEEKGWWMGNSIIDMLKGKAWLAGQEE